MRVKHVVADVNVFFKVAEEDHTIIMCNTCSTAVHRIGEKACKF